ncbi:plastocyanin/azurin family copper-binding protein [Halarchaeum sp. P4]|uniref:plastocyanin/azurin family copper-binding protein n=1 Tax=Halarchaeum sp. P4 TaxID=3421639 RepID=UPI003EBF0577
MKRRQFITKAGGASLAATGVVGSAAAQESSDPRQGSGTKDDPYIVEMRTEGSEFLFDPVGLYVEKGDWVRWVNVSGSHSTTAYDPSNPNAEVRLIPEGAKAWDSGTYQEQGATFDYQFQVEGTYDYYCIPHKTLGMVGRVVCGSPGGPAENQEIPDDVGSGVMPDSETIVEEKALAYPYFPETSGGPLPNLALGAAALFGIGNVYLLSQTDRFSGRYSQDTTDDTEIE